MSTWRASADALADALDGHCDTEVSFWEGVADLMIVQSMADLTTTAEASLSATVETIKADAMVQGTSWPILAQ